MATNLKRIGERARQDRKCRFTSIFHHVYDLDHLRACYESMEKGKKPGIDGETKESYGADLEANLEQLSERLARMGWRPKPVRRVYIPKPGSRKRRPLGLPCFEDKLVQLAFVRVLEPIYEADFLDCSYGYRPGRSQHQAVDRVGRTIQRGKVSYVAEADIRGFFEHVDHDWLRKFLELRIGDERVLRLIWRMLKAGVMEDGLETASEEGTPQGGVLSALLSNVYLHYALDLWVERRLRKRFRGEMYHFRYADDFVVCFQYRGEAAAYLRQLTPRLAKFGLEVEPSKTKLPAFGRFAEQDARQRGAKPGTFDFLGFTFYCGQTRHGSFKVKRRTSRRKFRVKLAEYRQWLRRQRTHLKTGEMLRQTKRRYEGHLQYYAITDNGEQCQAFGTQLTWLMFRWLNRRSQRRSHTWERFYAALDWVDWPRVRIRHNLCPFRVDPV